MGNDKALKKYLETSGQVYQGKWTIEELKKFVKDSDANDDVFEGWSSGLIQFNKTKKGRKYIQFERPGRFYLE